MVYIKHKTVNQSSNARLSELLDAFSRGDIVEVDKIVPVLPKLANENPNLLLEHLDELLSLFFSKSSRATLHTYEAMSIMLSSGVGADKIGEALIKRLNSEELAPIELNNCRRLLERIRETNPQAISQLIPGLLNLAKKRYLTACEAFGTLLIHNPDEFEKNNIANELVGIAMNQQKPYNYLDFKACILRPLLEKHGKAPYDKIINQVIDSLVVEGKRLIMANDSRATRVLDAFILIAESGVALQKEVLDLIEQARNSKNEDIHKYSEGLVIKPGVA